MKLKTYVNLLLMAGLLFTAGVVMADNVKTNVNSQKNFIDIFHNAKKTGKQITTVSDEVMAYVNVCCKDRAAAVQLLRDNGFEVHSKTYGPNEFYHISVKEHYEETILGKRGAGWWPFWDLFTQYRVTFFMNNGKVDLVSAGTVANLPF